MKRVAFLDGWRGLAVAAVLTGHFTIANGIDFGKLGVELFFVLSGRLMAEILFVREQRLPQFFLGRLSRIYPTMLLYVAVAFVATQFVPAYRIEPSLALASALTLANYTQFWAKPSGMLNHLWSLSVEVHLYMFLGAIALIHRRVRALNLGPTLAGLAALFALNGIVSTLLGGDYYTVYWRSDVRGASILAGATAHLFLRNKTVPPWVPLLLTAAGLAFNVEASPDPLKYTAGTVCFASAVALLPNLKGLGLAVFESRPLTSVGIVSYSLYLWQQPFALLGHKLLTVLPLLVVPAIGTGVASYFLVEKPTRQWLSGWIRRQFYPSATTVPAKTAEAA